MQRQAPPCSQRCHLTLFHRHISAGADALTVAIPGDETSSACLSSSVLPLVGQGAGTALAKLPHPPQWEGVRQKES